MSMKYITNVPICRYVTLTNLDINMEYFIVSRKVNIQYFPSTLKRGEYLIWSTKVIWVEWQKGERGGRMVERNNVVYYVSKTNTDELMNMN